MAYTPQLGGALDFTFLGESVHTPPAHDAVDFSFSSTYSGISIAATIPVVAAQATAHGTALGSVASVPVTAVQNMLHGVVLEGIASVALSAAASIEVARYEVRGEVRLGGVLVNRRVRAYQRASGALIGEVDTVIGKFALHTGFAPAEHYITPIDLDAGATDWSPPTANRIMSVLALDTA